MLNPILSFLGMFDKVDDIVYEPVKAICEGFKQPFKQIDAATERKKIELNHKLEMEMKQMGVDLEVEKKKKSAELIQWEKDAEFARQKETLEAIEEYQNNMGTTAVEIGKAIGTMSIDLQSKAQDMIVEKTKLFREQQIEALHDATQGIKEIQEMYPEDSELKTEIIRPYTEMMTNVVRETNAFVIDMKESMKQLSQNINVITGTVLNNTDKYVQPLCGGNLAGLSTQKLKENSINSNNSGYIENK